jgi:uncharacterized membrane protein
MSKRRHQHIEAMEITISNFLRLGVSLSAMVILIGVMMLFCSGNSGYPGTTFPVTITTIIQGLLALKPDAVILTGLLLLILTPAFRVGVSIITFIWEKDYLYVAITSVVLVILVIGFLLGKIA